MQQFDDIDQPAWLPTLDHWLQRLGLLRSVLLLALFGWLSALLCSWLVIRVIGQGNFLIAATIASACSIGLSLSFGYLLLRLVRYQQSMQARLARRAHQDGLTGAYNRRYFNDLAERELARAQRYEMSCALLLLDVDHFKQVNERCGPICGDQLLCEISEACAETLRQGDVLARFGGEEFAVFLPHTDPLGALDVAERLRARIAGLGFHWRGQAVPISISVGVAALRSEHLTLAQLVNDADRALANAKSQGRNCVRAGDGGVGGRSSFVSR
ncbi:GGDEF domain-containing protein [Roseateles sp.]|jgi:diguanylate cyclase|uniref:GGDEF domain-containing protein n=1 Tax=Roseateles sp. TaxID=1971397 RepID=UPI0037C51EDA